MGTRKQRFSGRTKILGVCSRAEARSSFTNVPSSLMTNHPGTQFTLDICRRYLYWPGMLDDVTLYVSACVTCGRSKQPQSYSKATRKHIIAHEFNQILVIDHDEAEKLEMTAGKRNTS